MSLRAIKKTQLQLKRQTKLEAEELTSSAEEDDVESVAPAPKLNAFALLGGPNEDGDDHDDEEDDTGDGGEDVSRRQGPSQTSQSKPKTPNKMKKRKAKAKNAEKNGQGDQSQSHPTGGPRTPGAMEMDEIDAALHSLAVSEKESETPPDDKTRHAVEEVCALVAVDPQRLIAANEMRQLFGRAVLEAEGHQAAEQPGARRRGREQPQGVAGALAGHHRAGAGGLAALSRRNLFVQGKEGWPTAMGVGLSMHMLGQRPSGVTKYAWVFNKSYQDAQIQYFICRNSMDPDRMVQHLNLNPWHVATLLEVSRMAEIQRDYATAADLVERALFSYGRALHSTFADRLSRGRARFKTEWPENSEFYHVVNRHIKNLSKRALWRTAYEWTKLLLAVSLHDDQSCVRYVIDQMALRSHQAQHLLDLLRNRQMAGALSKLPNIAASIPLAHLQLDQPDEARRTLFTAIKDRPWVFHRLFQELGIERIPPSIWGSEPRTPHERLLAELYVYQATDLWKTPEATSLLIEVAGISEQMLPAGDVDNDPIHWDEALLVLSMEVPQLAALLPRDLVTQVLDAAGRSDVPPGPPPPDAQPTLAAQEDTVAREETP